MKEQTKTIGLIGGMSWESSKFYYEFVNERTKQLLGDTHSCKSILITVDFAQIVKLTFAEDWEGIGKVVASAAQQLERAGADMVLLCTNLIHLVSDAIEESISVPFLHIAEATGREIHRQGLTKVGLLGTQFTMEKDFYTGYIKENFDIDVIIPEEDDRKTLHRIIYNELVKGKFTTSSKEICLKLMDDLIDKGAQGIIMGCTELPILVTADEVGYPTFDTGKIHAHAAVDWAVQALPLSV
ncbi:aspartate/glutamate racemase family protein [Spongiimicrobium sp. 2-473A-2-J]|uniref:aspartate/glutamate racemase family protein n=1 Tax=Eudoraea algarum TaxID=3417568 RepID=UPI003D35EA9A